MKQRDVNEALRLRTSTLENALSMGDLAGLGITPESTTRLLEEAAQGRICEEAGKTLGFTMGAGRSGEVLVLAVRPRHEDRGIGRGLLQVVQGWLFSPGHREIWLRESTDRCLRAHGFYRHLGWVPTGECRGPEQVLKLRRGRAEKGAQPR